MQKGKRPRRRACSLDVVAPVTRRSDVLGPRRCGGRRQWARRWERCGCDVVQCGECSATGPGPDSGAGVTPVSRLALAGRASPKLIKAELSGGQPGIVRGRDWKRRLHRRFGCYESILISACGGERVIDAGGREASHAMRLMMSTKSPRSAVSLPSPLLCSLPQERRAHGRSRLFLALGFGPCFSHASTSMTSWLWEKSHVLAVS
jgi:hypothetical protein